MKTTLEIPESIFRSAKTKAAERNVPRRKFVSDAVAEKLAGKPSSRKGAKRKLAGNLSHLRSETARSNRVIDQEFEKIEPEQWA